MAKMNFKLCRGQLKILETHNTTLEQNTPKTVLNNGIEPSFPGKMQN